MKARSFSHCGITVSSFNRAVQFYWDVFRCPLVGVADTPPDRVRTFFGVDAGTDVGIDSAQPRCKIGWIRVPGGAVIEIFGFMPSQPPVELPWNRVGLPHISLPAISPATAAAELLPRPRASGIWLSQTIFPGRYRYSWE